MILYHGTTANFENFSFDFIGTNGRAEGIGLYFTDSKEVASTYADNGRIFTINMIGKKPLSGDKITLSRREVEKLVIEMHKRRNILADFGDVDFEGVESVLRDCVESLLEDSTDDVEIISQISNVSGSPKDILDVVYNVLGYDYAVTKATWGYNFGQKNIYTVFTTDAIEILDIEDNF